jgi:hypothetical protein
LAEDRAISAEATATTSSTERDSLASRLALAEAEIKRLRAAATSTEEAAERAKTAAATAETVARDATQAAAREKVTLEAKVSDLESDLCTTTTDLATASRQFSQVTNQLLVAIEEVSQLQDSNVKLSQDPDGKLEDFPIRVWLGVCFLWKLDLMSLVAGLRLIHAGMVVQLATVKQERNTAILKVIEKDGVLKRSSE